MDRISESDMKNLMQTILDRNYITKTEYLTMFYILKILMLLKML